MIPKPCNRCKQKIFHNPHMPKIPGDYCVRYNWNLKNMKSVPKRCSA